MIRKSEIHMHSCFSDGEFSPRELVAIARKNGVSILSLTDHDTFSGIPEFIEAGRKAGLIVFPGIEMTVKYGELQLHVLGYFKDLESIQTPLWDRVETMKAQREERMVAMIDKLNGVVPDRFQGEITFENVQKAAEGVLARPHLAREMVRLGIVKHTGEAFEKYLVEYNVQRENIHIDEALKLMRASGGVPVVAHPGERTYALHRPDKGIDYEDIPARVEELKALGLMGLEAIYPYHERTGKVEYFLKLAEDHDMIVTGSRDFHGFNTHQTPDVLGTTKMEPDFFERFQQAWG
ncbi:PHP domain-containing protein [Nitrospina watsonii]|uniref:PHP domain protein n=1 Tax=Nitrospina watsonii TaxID=1323948 RepID=A0ABM9HF52_9BACT|nr:PHP domain-containing protein [Nitrospina watsonii]CAI2718888.1 Putative PHP domain protein [Nitrospina watsonii]